MKRVCNWHEDTAENGIAKEEVMGGMKTPNGRAMPTSAATHLEPGVPQDCLKTRTEKDLQEVHVQKHCVSNKLQRPPWWCPCRRDVPTSGAHERCPRDESCRAERNLHVESQASLSGVWHPRPRPRPRPCQTHAHASFLYRILAAFWPHQVLKSTSNPSRPSSVSRSAGKNSETKIEHVRRVL